MTSTVPADPGGTVAVMVESLVTVTSVAGLAPTSTAVAPVNPEPVIVTPTSPVVNPVAGLTSLTTGGGGEEDSMRVSSVAPFVS